jgi:hypothetical protein
MNRPFPHFDVARLARPEGMIPAIARSAKKSNANRQVRSGPNAVISLPKRPDLTVLSETIPLFYIGQNTRGFWVAHEADGRSGGLFLFKRSAVRFAHKSAPAGCAIMFLNESFELDLENRGSRLVESLTAAIDVAERVAPRLVTFLAMAHIEWRKLSAQIYRAIVSERRNRAAIERELFHGQYTLSSKNDDLPIP